jgi:hypothetical protein
MFLNGPQNRRHGVLSGAENTVGNPIIPPKDAPAYCDNYNRFNRDVAGELHEKKQQSLQKKEVRRARSPPPSRRLPCPRVQPAEAVPCRCPVQDLYAVKRVENYARERSTYDAMVGSQERSAKRLEAARTSGTGARRNQVRSQAGRSICGCTLAVAWRVFVWKGRMS